MVFFSLIKAAIVTISISIIIIYYITIYFVITIVIIIVVVNTIIHFLYFYLFRGRRVVAEILCYLKVLIKNTPTQVMINLWKDTSRTFEWAEIYPALYITIMRRPGI